MKKAGFKKTVVLVIVVLAMVFGAVILGRALGLSPFASPGFDKNAQFARVEGNVQIVAIEVHPDKYVPIVVQKGIPVRFILNAEASDLTECNKVVVISKYNIQKSLLPGDNNIISFTPQETGKIPYSCHMGMIKSSIQVVDDVAKSKEAAGK